MNVVPVALGDDRDVELSRPRWSWSRCSPPSTVTSGPTSSPPSWAASSDVENRTHRPRGRLYSLGRCLIRERWRSSTAALRPSTRSRASRRAASSQTALEAGWMVTAIGLTHDKRWVDADRVLVDIGRGRRPRLARRPAPPRSRRRARAPRRRPAARRGRVPRAARALRRGRRDPGPPRGAAASPTSVPACSPPPSAWTRASPSRCCTTTASRWRPGGWCPGLRGRAEVMEEAVGRARACPSS